MTREAKQTEMCSLASFNETDTKSCINSPRSLQACKQEGVLPQELIYKPVEAFQERSLSPRLVKLRYDFFEAKRRDLLAASRRARDAIIAEEKREKENSNQQLELISKESGLSKGAIMALNSEGLAQERRKLLKAQENERNWLKNALSSELKQLQKLETSSLKLNEEASLDEDRMREASRRLKELNDKRHAEEERKQMELDARLKLEKQIAKEEFHRQQEELKQRGEMEALKQKEIYERQQREAERKRQAEIEKAEKKEQAAREMEAKKNELRAQDLRRQEVLEQQREAAALALKEKQENRGSRVYMGLQATQELDRKRREEFEEKMRAEQIREERLAQARALEQEESAKKAFQVMMKRKIIQEESQRRAEERRMAILEQQDETEQRLLEHEQKKERYLDFKRELDGLRSKNKEINVERQRRKEEAQRERIAEEVRKKDEKIGCVHGEKQRLWQIRRAAQLEAYRAREIVKTEIMKQRVASRYDSKALESKLSALMKHDLFAPHVIHTSTSMPTLQSKSSGSQSSEVVYSQEY
mmetsp:Transcript_63122/g.137192  ORF Transcript_63122/g.137192 Transcript_63122/m.137192 type:complete len:533 (+) Transcript_63122:185-1783(+)|eukprot:CAMPEP_0170614600 /NCGR_PEP_ID=MMETSP0224-20130122/24891_1 /TAXON_ID=285029 /ORGANISM="Togula jolla, Strain CCCM 725" /LENGTH=532 /DNA_ID=CAMNT_0010940277 /DNA_START=87 /DNA_END=1685 /DNA_ORIENTATION=+